MSADRHYPAHRFIDPSHYFADLARARAHRRIRAGNLELGTRALNAIKRENIGRPSQRRKYIVRTTKDGRQTPVEKGTS